MQAHLPNLLFIAGVGQLCVLVASALVPIRLNWREELRSLSRLHRQMYWIYGGYIVLAIIGLGLISVFNARELASGSGLARGFCGFVAVFWGVRLSLQCVLDVKEHLNSWRLKLGYALLSVFFAYFTAVYAWAAMG